MSKNTPLQFTMLGAKGSKSLISFIINCIGNKLFEIIFGKAPSTFGKIWRLINFLLKHYPISFLTITTLFVLGLGTAIFLIFRCFKTVGQYFIKNNRDFKKVE